MDVVALSDTEHELYDKYVHEMITERIGQKTIVVCLILVDETEVAGVHTIDSTFDYGMIGETSALKEALSKIQVQEEEQ